MTAQVLSIAGTDPTGGAGMPVDLKTFAALGCAGLSVVTAVLAQNSHGVSAIHRIPGDFIGRQLDAVFEDVRVDSVKIGMLGSADAVRAVAEALGRHRPAFVVLDPVMAASAGGSLLDSAALETLRTELLPLVDLVTPNLPEAARLLGEREAADEAQMLEQLHRLRLMASGVLLKGGHLLGDDCVDLLHIDGAVSRLAAPRVPTTHTRGTGCILSSAIAALRPKRSDWASAVADAKQFLTEGLKATLTQGSFTS